MGKRIEWKANKRWKQNTVHVQVLTIDKFVRRTSQVILHENVSSNCYHAFRFSSQDKDLKEFR